MDNIFRANNTIPVQIMFTLNKYLLFSKRAALFNLQQNTIQRLFPTEKNFSSQKYVQNLKQGVLFDKSIFNNDQQLQAVSHILGKTSGTSPYILFGPPGTGKTATIVEAIKQVYFQRKSSRIVVTAPSNLATNLLALKLLETIPQSKVHLKVCLILINWLLKHF
jgi:helicase MOV-10